jgi:hypothetical protein
MNDALFKQLAQDLSPEEESEFTRRLAAAYREHEARERSPEVDGSRETMRGVAQVALIVSAENDLP